MGDIFRKTVTGKVLFGLMLALTLQPATAGQGGTDMRLLYSGHSLLDQPIPDYVATLAQQQGMQLGWAGHNLVGSAISTRLQDLSQPEPLNQGRALPPFDHILITEQHGLLDALIWQQTPQALAAYLDWVLAQSPGIQAHFYEPWLSLDFARPLQAWVDYETQASHAWGCVVRASGQTNISMLPAGRALGSLVTALLQDPILLGLPADADELLIARALFKDDVHLTDAGSYYIAVIIYLFLFADPLHTAWHPDALSADTASVLRQQAQAFWAAELGTPTPTMDCAEFMAQEFAPLYLAYVRDKYWLAERGWLGAWARWLRFRLQWPAQLREIPW